MVRARPLRMRIDPFVQFARWFRQAAAHPSIRHPEGACLSTADRAVGPDGRMVLVKDIDARGFVFYTNLRSPKCRALRHSPRAALTFDWAPLGRQVRIRGTTVRVSAAEADAYFASRPREAQLGAWASDQSALLPSRAALIRRVAIYTKRFRGRAVARPPFWSGFRVVPDAIEFWQERPHRLHDRFLYIRTRAGRWTLTRRFP